jgi:hypothetical protein
VVAFLVPGVEEKDIGRVRFEVLKLKRLVGRATPVIVFHGPGVGPLEHVGNAVQVAIEILTLGRRRFFPVEFETPRGNPVETRFNSFNIMLI